MGDLIIFLIYMLINIRVGKDVYVLVLRLYQVRVITVFTVFGC
jgi:hypothetical protein